LQNEKANKRKVIAYKKYYILHANAK